MIESLGKILPARILAIINSRLNSKKVFEIRLRSGRAVCINYGSKLYYLCDEGICNLKEKAIVLSSRDVNEVVLRATNYSLYAVNDQLKNGFLTLKGGVRVGIAGEVVRDGEQIKTIKNFYSVNIRVPHEVIGCSDIVFKHCFEGEINNTLIISPPGSGKTTLLRDIARKLSDKNPKISVLLVDERSELAAVHDGVSQLDVGENTDCLSNCTKHYAFSLGIRSMAPNVIITDELLGADDLQATMFAASCGVSVVASIHARCYEDLVNKSGFDRLLNAKIFTRIVELSSRDGPGTVTRILDESLNVIYNS